MIKCPLCDKQMRYSRQNRLYCANGDCLLFLDAISEGAVLALRKAMKRDNKIIDEPVSRG